MIEHQYIERETGSVRTECLFGDQLVRLLYHGARESAPALFRMATSSWSTGLLGLINYDLPFNSNRRFLEGCRVNLAECLDPPEGLNTPRKVFERRIRYEECRPMPDSPSAVVSPADARVLVGSFLETSSLFLKEKFFDFDELLGGNKQLWLREFAGGDFAVFRLTPDKYHYNHTPVAGVVQDIYEIDGDFHSCNPGAIVAVATPFSKNRRVVTVIDTDVPDGTGVGLVAMIEVVALMIGQIVQCYSDHGYSDPRSVEPGMFLQRGKPKSLYRPGSSTDVLLFQRDRLRFADDILRNMHDVRASSRFTSGFSRPLVETDIKVRSLVAVSATD